MVKPESIREKYRTFVQLNPSYKELLVPNSLPFERFKVYEKWKPDTVIVLFIAESPPWNESDYFYNDNSHGGLSEAVFKHLDVEGSSKTERLRKFKNQGFFLIDTIKCIFKKDGGKAIPQKLIKFSAQEVLQ